MTIKKTRKDGLGNTNSSPTKEIRSLCFTWNNYKKSEKSDILNWLKSRKNMSYIFQEETGENGTPHLQGVFKCKSPIKWETLKHKFPKVHWEVTKSWEKSIEYCSKDDTRTGEIYKSDDIKLKIPIKDPLAGKKLYKYQREIIKLLKSEPDDRKIYWYWEDTGNVGKSALVKHIYLKYPGEVVIATGKGNDVRNQINNHINVEGKELKIAILDISRTVEDYVSYEVIEQIKNGLLYSGKYEGGVCCFNSPHIIAFANFEPKKDALSSDRWDIREIPA